MFELHGIVPRSEHYAGMIDLLGWVDFLEDAKKTIDHIIQSIWCSYMAKSSVCLEHPWTCWAGKSCGKQPSWDASWKRICLCSSIKSLCFSWYVECCWKIKKRDERKKILSRTILVLAGFKLVDQFITLWLMIPHILKVKKYMRSQ